MAKGKVPENTLIVNFTTAIGCPAWNECLVKHACYARQTEKGKPSVYDGNDRFYGAKADIKVKIEPILLDPNMVVSVDGSSVIVSFDKINRP